MAYRSIRGAITVEKDDSRLIFEAARLLLTSIIEQNNLVLTQIISILFTATADLTAAYPAVAARDMGITEAALMCAQEMRVNGSLEKCIRVQVNVETECAQSAVKHIYLREAEKLRPDIAGKAARGKGGPFYAIAIDGPAGAGKGTVAKIAAERLGFLYVDTGAMYRAAALYCINNGVAPSDTKAVEGILGGLDISIVWGSGGQRVMLGGTDVTGSIRSPQVSEGSSMVAVHKKVREKLVALQQKLAEGASVVMEGRDIGTHVLPNATLKVYLDASATERTNRRRLELAQKGLDISFDELFKEIEQRDIRDATREESPLIKARDAVVIDTSDMSADEAAYAIELAFKEKL